MANRAVFVDRDNTLIEDITYQTDPNAVKLLPGVELAIKSIRQAGFKLVVVTNQSGIARGLLTEEQLEKIHSRLREMLADKGAMLDAIYYCPFHPDGSVDRYAKDSDLRKPKPGMLLKAAKTLDLDLAESWMVGDGSGDIGAGQQAGCRTIRIRQPEAKKGALSEEDSEEFQADYTVRNLVDAARVILRQTARGGVKKPESSEPADSSEPGQDAAAEQSDSPVTKHGEDRPATPLRDQSLSDMAHEARTSSGLEALVSQTSLPATENLDAHEEQTDPELDSEVRREILRYVRQMAKQQDVETFNLGNLLGGVAQMFTLLFLLLTFWHGVGKEEYPIATLWGIIAMVFQTMSLTFFMMGKKSE
jgi:D,D-heptose 1,7-bisphosphate phosphatase